MRSSRLHAIEFEVCGFAFFGCSHSVVLRLVADWQTG